MQSSKPAASLRSIFAATFALMAASAVKADTRNSDDLSPPPRPVTAEQLHDIAMANFLAGAALNTICLNAPNADYAGYRFSFVDPYMLAKGWPAMESVIKALPESAQRVLAVVDQKGETVSFYLQAYYPNFPAVASARLRCRRMQP